MRRYEVVFVLAPTLSDEEVSETAEGFAAVATEKGANVLEVDKEKLGRRRLAFPVKKHTEGHYIVLTLEEEAAEAVFELERRFKVSDAVIRFLSIRIDEDLKRAEKFKDKRDARKGRKQPAGASSRGKDREPAGVEEE